MEYTYNILNDVYDWMKSKQKNVEVRILKEKSEKIQVNDFIIFNNQALKNKFIKTKVVSKKIFSNIEELLNEYEVNRIMPNHNENELKELLNKIYSDELKNSKLVAFGIEYISSDSEV